MEKEIIGTAELYCGDCLDVMAALKPMQVDLCITDPPYMISVSADSSGKLNHWMDMCNAAYWFAEVYRQIDRVLKQDAAFWSFLNWRSQPTVAKAAIDAKLSIKSMLVWDKEWIGPGGMQGLRPAYELAAFMPKGEFAISDRGIPDIKRCKWSSKKPNGHPAEKPEMLVDWLLQISGEGSVIDPFMGSGTTGACATAQGRKFIGIEHDRQWFDYACKRIEAAQTQGRLAI